MKIKNPFIFLLLFPLLMQGQAEAQSAVQQEQLKAAWQHVVVDFRRCDDLYLNFVVSVKAAGLAEKAWTGFQKDVYHFDSLITRTGMPDSVYLQQLSVANSSVRSGFDRLLTISSKRLGDANMEIIAPLISQTESAHNRLSVSINDYNKIVQDSGLRSLLYPVIKAPAVPVQFTP